MIYTNVEQLIGNTPLMELTQIEKKFNLKSKIYAKIEKVNPSGSIKDRAALYMIKDAEEKGLKKGDTLIEPTSGNTGIGLAMLCAIKGYKLIIVMPETMSVERQKLIRAYGAEIILTEGKKGMGGSIEKAEELEREIKGSMIVGQFDNPANAKSHFETTGPEIWNDLDGKVDYFIAGFGTGGTVSGTGKYLKSKNKEVKVIGVEPFSSPLVSKGTSGAHALQGIGANFIPTVLDVELLDEVRTVTNEDAYSITKLMPILEGLLVGITSGANVSCAIDIAKEVENKNIVVVLPDTGERYLSTTVFD